MQPGGHPMKSPTRQPTHDNGVILAGAVYALPEFLRRVCWGRKTWTSAQRAGLPSIQIGRQRYVLGEDFLAFCREQRGGSED